MTYACKILHYNSFDCVIDVSGNNVLTEAKVHSVCREELKGNGQFMNPRMTSYIPKCSFIHHFNPFVKLGPFHLEIHFYRPFRGIFHDFLSEKEMQRTVNISIPKLSASRTSMNKTKYLAPYGRNNKDFRKPNTVEKSVVTWLFDIEYNEKQVFYKTSKKNKPLKYDVMPLHDPYSFTVTDRMLFILSKRVESAINLNITKRHSSSPYQTTNYGLAGIVERHIDPIGYEKGAIIEEEQKHLIQSGDIIATFMAWLKDTDLGGATAFTEQNFENAVYPKKGSAAFWFNLSSCHTKDSRAKHAACPVLKGTKWIFNKWMYSYDQWKQIPCGLISGLTISHFADLYKH